MLIGKKWTILQNNEYKNIYLMWFFDKMFVILNIFIYLCIQ